MTITRDTINAMQGILNGLTLTFPAGHTSIMKAPDVSRYPTGMNTAQLPLALTWPGASSFDYEGMAGGKRRFAQSLTIIVYIQPLGQNDIPSRAEEALLWLDVVRNKLLDVVAIFDVGQKGYQVTLQQSQGQPHRDSGLISSLQFGGVPHFGFTIDVTARILRSI